MPQPALCLLHQEVAPFVSAAMERSTFKLFPVLMDAAKKLAALQGVGLNELFLNREWSGDAAMFDDGGMDWTPTEAQWEGRHLWFANLNTPEDFRAAAKAFTGLLETD
jgi:molybdopterin-guanine dinucleotide biosynthesis protein A